MQDHKPTLQIPPLTHSTSKNSVFLQTQCFAFLRWKGAWHWWRGKMCSKLFCFGFVVVLFLLFDFFVWLILFVCGFLLLLFLFYFFVLFFQKKSQLNLQLKIYFFNFQFLSPISFLKAIIWECSTQYIATYSRTTCRAELKYNHKRDWKLNQNAYYTFNNKAIAWTEPQPALSKINENCFIEFKGCMIRSSQNYMQYCMQNCKEFQDDI